jgi:hypothetical protein
MDWKKQPAGTFISLKEHDNATIAYFAAATRVGSSIVVPCYGGVEKLEAVFDLEAREVRIGGVRIPMASITRCDIDYYVIEGDMKESLVFCLIISDGEQEIKLSDRVKDYYGFSDPELERANDRLLLNLHALPPACDIPCRQTYCSEPPDSEAAFTEEGRASSSPPGPHDALIGCGILLAAAAVIILIILFFIRR